MVKLTDGIEVGEFEGADKNAKDDEPKQRGGDGSAKCNYAHPQTEFAHKRPVTG